MLFRPFEEQKEQNQAL